MDNACRIDQLRLAMVREDVDLFFTQCRPNVQYLTGFPGGGGGLLVTDEEAFLLLDGRFTAQAAESVPGFPVLDARKPTLDSVADFAARRGLRSLGIEADRMVQAHVQRLRDLCTGCEIRPLTGLVEGIRVVKDAAEIEALEGACAVAAEALAAVRPAFQPGRTEKEVEDLLEAAIRAAGGERSAFLTSVLAGERSAQPHGRPSDRRLRPGDVLLLDFGARVDGYLSDLTRVFLLPGADEEWKRLYAIVLEAQTRAIEAVAPGRPLADVDRAARETIADAGLGESFFHAVGHGVGRELHEAPGVRAGASEEMEPGMVFTVEPGVYLPGRGGIRIEGMVLVEETGCRVLSSRLPRGLDDALLDTFSGSKSGRDVLPCMDVQKRLSGV